MKQITAGASVLISATNLTIEIKTDVTNRFSSEIDSSAFLLRNNGKVNNENDFIFYNQPATSDGSVKMTIHGNNTLFNLDLSRVDPLVTKIALAIVIDGPDQFDSLSSLDVIVNQDISFMVKTQGMKEKALMLAQVYRHQGDWKYKAVGQGFNGGLLPLARYFGVDATMDPIQEAEPKYIDNKEPTVILTIDLAKQLASKAPQLIKLAKPIEISLKKNNLEQQKSRVAFVLDASGSMYQQFKKGYVQQVLERITALAVQFDDDQSLDIWAFGTKYKKYKDVTLDNIADYIKLLQLRDKKPGVREIIPGLGGRNDEPAVMTDVFNYYRDSKEPVYVVFISDGGVSQSRAISKIIRESAHYPIFWQFVGLGGKNYGILEQFDDLDDRLVDNCNFFKIDDFNDISDEELYRRLLNEFPDWLKEIKAIEMINLI